MKTSAALWIKLGLLLSAIVSPRVLALLFYATVTGDDLRRLAPDETNPRRQAAQDPGLRRDYKDAFELDWTAR